MQLLPAHLHMDSDAAGRALTQIFSRALPQVTEDGIRQVMDLVWAAEKFTAVKGSPAKYLDLSYLHAASA